MTQLGLLDTSTVILLGRIADPATLPEESVISAITLAALSVGPHVAATDAERIARQAHLQQAENDFDVIAFDAGAARAFGIVAGALRNAGRKTSARAYDALIAATATPRDFRCTPAIRTTSRVFPG
jgi:predicted nucleic acid-binding protein